MSQQADEHTDEDVAGEEEAAGEDAAEAEAEPGNEPSDETVKESDEEEPEDRDHAVDYAPEDDIEHSADDLAGMPGGTGRLSVKNSFVPSILPEWKNLCIEDNARRKPIELTEENAPQYANIASNVGWKGRVDYALEYIEKDSEVDANLLACLLETVVSTVISFASGKTPSDDYMVCTSLYLQYIRNEFGENPPNIAAFLDYIRVRSSDEVMETLESIQESDDEGIPPHVVITQLPKTLQQRLLE